MLTGEWEGLHVYHATTVELARLMNSSTSTYTYCQPANNNNTFFSCMRDKEYGTINFVSQNCFVTHLHVATPTLAVC